MSGCIWRINVAPNVEAKTFAEVVCPTTEPVEVENGSHWFPHWGTSTRKYTLAIFQCQRTGWTDVNRLEWSWTHNGSFREEVSEGEGRLGQQVQPERSGLTQELFEWATESTTMKHKMSFQPLGHQTVSLITLTVWHSEAVVTLVSPCAIISYKIIIYELTALPTIHTAHLYHAHSWLLLLFLFLF